MLIKDEAYVPRMKLYFYQFNWNEKNCTDDFYNNFFFQGKIEGIWFSSLDQDSVYNLYKILNNRNFFTLTFLYVQNKQHNTITIDCNASDIYKIYDPFTKEHIYFYGEFNIKIKHINYNYANYLVFNNLYFFDKNFLLSYIDILKEQNEIQRTYNLE